METKKCLQRGIIVSRGYIKSGRKLRSVLVLQENDWLVACLREGWYGLMDICSDKDDWAARGKKMTVSLERCNGKLTATNFILWRNENRVERELGETNISGESGGAVAAGGV